MSFGHISHSASVHYKYPLVSYVTFEIYLKFDGFNFMNWCIALMCNKIHVHHIDIFLLGMLLVLITTCSILIKKIVVVVYSMLAKTCI